MYGVINAITQVSKQYAMEQRFMMETYAGLLIDDPKLWQNVLARA